MVRFARIFLCDSPFSSIHDNQENTQNDLAKPSPEEEWYVSLPGHPLYGQRVQIIKYEPAATARYCQIRDPIHSDFHYQIKASWLSTAPPLPVSPTSFRQSAVQLALPALDKMVQSILVHRPAWRSQEDERSIQTTSRPDLGSDSPLSPPEVQRTTFLPGSETGGRHSP